MVSSKEAHVDDFFGRHPILLTVTISAMTHNDY